MKINCTVNRYEYYLILCTGEDGNWKKWNKYDGTKDFDEAKKMLQMRIEEQPKLWWTIEYCRRTVIWNPNTMEKYNIPYDTPRELDPFIEHGSPKED